MRRRAGIVVAVGVLLALVPLAPATAVAGTARQGTSAAAGPLTVLPEDGRSVYLDAFAAAEGQIRIEICVLEDPEILQGLQAALDRGVRVRAIVDRGKYEALPAEQANLAQHLTGAGGELHLSNPVFPRAFPKIVIIDDALLVFGSACLDQTTFAQYRDFALRDSTPRVVRSAIRLFENDWGLSAPVGSPTPALNPTPPLAAPDLLVAPIDATTGLVGLARRARTTIDVYTEELGNPTLAAELAAAVTRGVQVRLITPVLVNGAPPAFQAQQDAAIAALVAAGVAVRTSGPEQSATQPYMHARAVVVDGGRVGYLGSISFSPDSATVNREFGMLLRRGRALRELHQRFEADFATLTPAAT